MKIHKKPNVMAYFEHGAGDGDGDSDDDGDYGVLSVANFSSFSPLSLYLSLALSQSLFALLLGLSLAN